jgi:hypothetical integral membrane protein (TIGR02206 family)
MAKVGEHDFITFGPTHLAYLAGTALVWVLVLWWGKSALGPEQAKRVAIYLAVFSVGQELADDLIRTFHGVWVVQEALPLHLCSLAMLMSAFALATKRQRAFEVAYYWGLAAASQALITPDHTRWTLGRLDVFWNFMSHGLVILNVLWLIVVDGMRCRRRSWLVTFGITNLMLIPIGLINLAIGSNYFFICRKPGGESPFLVGEWPFYLIWFELLCLVFFWLIYQPMAWARRRGGTG